MRKAAGSILIQGARVYRGRDDAAQPRPADILVRDGRIAALVESGAGAAPPGVADKIIDGRHKLVIPGLVNAHYHSHDVLARGLFEDLPLETWITLAIPGGRPVSARETRLRTLLGAAECLLSGITTIQDMVGSGPGAEEQVETIKQAYDEIGIRCVLGLQVGNRSALACLPGLAQDLPAELRPLLDPPQPTPQAIVDFVAAALRAPTHGRLTWAIAPGSPQRCTRELLEGLAALGRERDLPVVTHVNETKLQVVLAHDQLGDHGRSWVDYLDAAGLLNQRLAIAHGIWLHDREIARIAEAGAAVVTNPTSNLKLKAGVAPLRKLHQAGVNLALGCDNVSAGDAQNLFQAMKLVCTMSAAKGPEAAHITAGLAFGFATAGGARMLKLDREIGTIDVGKAADLTLLDLADPAYVPLAHALRQVVYSECGRGVDTVLVDGEIVVEHGRLTTVDWPALCEEAADLAQAYTHDLETHRHRMTPVLPYIADAVRRAGAVPLPFNRWLAGDDAA